MGVADDEEGFVAAFADPIEDLGVGDGGVNGVYRRIGVARRGVEGDGEVVDAAVAVARTGAAVSAAGDLPLEGEACVVGHAGILVEMHGVVMENAVVGLQGVESYEGRGVAGHISDHQLCAAHAGATVEGEHRLPQRLVEGRQDGVAAGACRVHAGDMRSVGSGVDLTADKRQEGVVGCDGAEVIGAGGIAHTAEVDRGLGVGGIVILCRAVAESRPAVGHLRTCHIGTYRRVVNIT